MKRCGQTSFIRCATLQGEPPGRRERRRTEIVARLRDEGHTALYVAEMEPGISDETVLDLANREDRLLLTADNNFGELAFRQSFLPRSGVALIRLAGLTPKNKARKAASTTREHAAEIAPGTFSVITPGAVRIRRTNP